MGNIEEPAETDGTSRFIQMGSFVLTSSLTLWGEGPSSRWLTSAPFLKGE